MNKLNQAMEFIKLGNKNKAQQLLAELVQAEPNNEQAWLWMSAAIDNASRQIYCLEQVLRINPDNQHALTGLSKLKLLKNQSVNGVVQNSVVKRTVEPANATNSKYTPQPIPDISKWPCIFTGWSVWSDVADSDHNTSNTPRELGLGLLITEKTVAAKRILRWAAFFAAIAIALGIPTFFVSDITASLIMGAAALIFLGAAFYQFMNWYLNQDLRVRIFREGFTFTKNGETQVVFWRDVDYVREQWRKVTYQGVIQDHKHKIEIHKSNGQKVEMDRMLENIEEIGRLVQLAVADHLLPGKVENLKNEGTCDFGSFKISRYGITYKEKKFLPWNKVKSLDVSTRGWTDVMIRGFDSGKWTTWATENGGSVLNLQLFLALTYWFISAAAKPATAETGDPLDIDTPSDDQFDGTEYCQLFVTKKEAQHDSQRTLYVGTSKHERRLVVKVPAGVKSGTVYRFPDYGRPNPKDGTAGALNVEIIVEAVTQFQANWEVAQMTIGVILFILGMVWVISESVFDLITSAALAV